MSISRTIWHCDVTIAFKIAADGTIVGCPPSLQKLGVLCPEHCVACYSSHSCLPSHSCSRSPAPSMPAQRAQTTFVICHTTSSVEVLPLTSLRHCLTMVPHWHHLSQAHVDCLHAINKLQSVCQHGSHSSNRISHMSKHPPPQHLAAQFRSGTAWCRAGATSASTHW